MIIIFVNLGEITEVIRKVEKSHIYKTTKQLKYPIYLCRVNILFEKKRMFSKMSKFKKKSNKCISKQVYTQENQTQLTLTNGSNIEMNRESGITCVPVLILC